MFDCQADTGQMPSGRCGKVHLQVYFSDVLLVAPRRLGCVLGDAPLKSLQNYFLNEESQVKLARDWHCLVFRIH